MELGDLNMRAFVCLKSAVDGDGMTTRTGVSADGRTARSNNYRRGFGESGGARRDRTADLLNAIQALSQLSYDPWV